MPKVETTFRYMADLKAIFLIAYVCNISGLIPLISLSHLPAVIFSFFKVPGEPDTKTSARFHLSSLPLHSHRELGVTSHLRLSQSTQFH